MKIQKQKIKTYLKQMPDGEEKMIEYLINSPKTTHRFLAVLVMILSFFYFLR